jgi:hypothetical protein
MSDKNKIGIPIKSGPLRIHVSALINHVLQSFIERRDDAIYY